MSKPYNITIHIEFTAIYLHKKCWPLFLLTTSMAKWREAPPTPDLFVSRQCVSHPRYLSRSYLSAAPDRRSSSQPDGILGVWQPIFFQYGRPPECSFQS